MPSTYAHYRFGKEVYSKLNDSNKARLRLNKQLFFIGLHGPDILFYYDPLKINDINQIGYGTHELPGRDFFENAARVIRFADDKDAYYSYIYGFICHFALDRACHGYIDEYINSTGISHTEIEVEFDRKLMILDGFDPITHILTNHIVPSTQNADVIYHFFNKTNSSIIKKSLTSMIKHNKLLIAPSKIKRFFVLLLLKLTGNYKEMHGLLVNYKANPMCHESCVTLFKLYKDAINTAVKLIADFDSYVDGSKELSAIYDYTFGAKLLEE